MNVKTGIHAPAPLPLDLQDPDLIEAWEAFLEHRRQKKKKLTARACEAKFKRFRVWGAWYAALLLKIAVEKGWTDVYEPDRETRFEDGDFLYRWKELEGGLEFYYLTA